MFFDYLLLIILAITPLYYRYNLYIYIIESKSYNLRFFKNFLKSNDWKNLLYNHWFILEIFIWLLSILMIFNPPFEVIYYNIFFYFLILENIYVLWKIVRKKILKPSHNFVNILSFIIILNIIVIDFITIYFTNSYKIIYPTIIVYLFFSPLLWSIIPYVISIRKIKS